MKSSPVCNQNNTLDEIPSILWKLLIEMNDSNYSYKVRDFLAYWDTYCDQIKFEDILKTNAFQSANNPYNFLWLTALVASHGFPDPFKRLWFKFKEQIPLSVLMENKLIEAQEKSILHLIAECATHGKAQALNSVLQKHLPDIPLNFILSSQNRTYSLLSLILTAESFPLNFKEASQIDPIQTQLWGKLCKSEKVIPILFTDQGSSSVSCGSWLRERLEKRNRLLEENEALDKNKHSQEAIDDASEYLDLRNKCNDDPAIEPHWNTLRVKEEEFWQALLPLKTRMKAAERRKNIATCLEALDHLTLNSILEILTEKTTSSFVAPSHRKGNNAIYIAATQAITLPPPNTYELFKKMLTKWRNYIPLYKLLQEQKKPNTDVYESVLFLIGKVASNHHSDIEIIRHLNWFMSLDIPQAFFAYNKPTKASSNNENFLDYITMIKLNASSSTQIEANRLVNLVYEKIKNSPEILERFMKSINVEHLPIITTKNNLPVKSDKLTSNNASSTMTYHDSSKNILMTSSESMDPLKALLFSADNHTTSDDIDWESTFKNNLPTDLDFITPSHVVPSPLEHDSSSGSLLVISPQPMEIEEKRFNINDHERFEDAQVKYNPSPVVPNAGIHSKYLGGTLAPLPKPPRNLANPPVTYHHEFTLSPLSNVLMASRCATPSLYTLDDPFFSVEYYTTCENIDWESTQFTFVCAGRKNHALIPTIQQGRVVLVLTPEELSLLKLSDSLPSNIDALVIKKLRTPQQEDYSQLGAITCRRLAVCLLMHRQNISYGMMLDDNIAKVRFNSTEHDASWETIFNLMKEACSSTKVTTSIRTEGPKPIADGQLGSKAFMLNMGLMKPFFQELADIFLLFPRPCEEKCWGEDYYFQLYLYEAFKLFVDIQGYQILPDELICLQRSPKHRNHFAKTNGAIAKTLKPWTQEELARINDPFKQECVMRTIEKFNQIVLSNVDIYENQKEVRADADLLRLHAIAQGVQLTQHSSDLSKMPEELNFSARFRAIIQDTRFPDGFLFPYQSEAINHIAQSNLPQMSIKMATASGKSYVTCALATLAYHAASAGQTIAIVTYSLNLTRQLYRDFLKFNKDVGSPLAIPESAIVTISADKKSLHVANILTNRRLSNQKSIQIYCVDSFEKIIQEEADVLQNTALCLLDEYHAYYNSPSIQKFLRETAVENDTIVVGSTATPPRNNLLPQIFSYEREQGIKEGRLAPVVAGCIASPYSDLSLDDILPFLPDLLKNIYHPGLTNETKTLSELKGILYVNSIDECNRAYEFLRQRQVNCYQIHSKNNNNEESLQSFSDCTGGAVLIAHRMLGVGYNEKQLGWIISLEHTSADNASQEMTIEQKIGRLMRLFWDKVGLIITLKSTHNNIVRKILGRERIDKSLSPDYLAQQPIACYCTKENKHVVVELDALPLDATPIFTVEPYATEHLQPYPQANGSAHFNEPKLRVDEFIMLEEENSPTVPPEAINDTMQGIASALLESPTLDAQQDFIKCFSSLLFTPPQASSQHLRKRSAESTLQEIDVCHKSKKNG